MTDLSALSNEELTALYKQRQQASAPDLTKLSDAELKQLYAARQNKDYGPGDLARLPGKQQQLQDALALKAQQMRMGVPAAATISQGDQQIAGDQGPIAAWGVQAANSMLGGIPRAVYAGAATALGRGNGFWDNYEQAKAKDEALARLHPTATTLGTVTGIGGQIAATGPLGPLATTAVNTGLGATEGYLDSGGNAKAAAMGAGYGLIGTGLGYGAGNLVGKALGSRAVAKFADNVAPSIDDIEGVASKAYKAADEAGVTYSKGQFNKFLDEIDNKLFNGNLGYSKGNVPETVKALKDLRAEAVSGNDLTMTKLDNLRQVVSGYYNPKTIAGKDASALTDLKKALDNFMEKGAQVSGGDQEAAFQALKEARAAWSSKSTSEAIQGALQRATENAATSGSGGNIENAIRQQVKALLRSKSTNLTDAERKALEDAAYGNRPLRFAGKFSPTNPLYAAMATILGSSSMGPIGYAIPAVSAAAKHVADANTVRKVQIAAALARGRTDPTFAAKVALARQNAVARPSLVGALAGGQSGLVLGGQNTSQ